MKKILVLMLVLALATPFMFSWHDLGGTAGVGNYTIDMKLHNPAQAMYQNIEMEVALPIHEKFKMYFWIKDLTMSADFNKEAAFLTSNALSSQKWNLKGALRMYLGFNISDTFQMNILVGGGSANIGMNPWWGAGAAGTYTVVNYDDGKVETKSGQGLVQFGVGLVLKSAMFGSVIDNLSIINIFEMQMGYGDNYFSGLSAYTGTTYNSEVTSTRPGASVNDIKSEVFVFAYDLEVGTGIPIQIGLPRFNIGLNYQFKLQYATMTAMSNGTVLPYDVNPSKLNVNTNFKINFGINPTDNISTNTWLKPELNIDNYSWDPTGALAQSVLLPSFTLRFGQNVNITFAKICYVKFENEWKYTGGMTGFSVRADGVVNRVDGSMTDHTKTVAGQWTNSILDNPAMEIGFRFSGWTLGAGWRPRITVYDTSNNATDLGNGGAGNGFSVSSGADTNILNLSNWEVTMSVSFPPPAK